MEGSGDFGLSGLSAKFQQEWRPRTGLALVSAWASRDEAEAARAVLDDTVLLAESSLPDWALDSLWFATTGGVYNLDRAGTNARDWLRRLARVCAHHIYCGQLEDWDPEGEGRIPDGMTGIPGPVSWRWTGVVLDELLLAAPRLTRATQTAETQLLVSGVAPALELVVREVSPDLGFRLLLRCLSVYRVPLAIDRFHRFTVIGERFGYGSGLVQLMADLIDSDDRGSSTTGHVLHPSV